MAVVNKHSSLKEIDDYIIHCILNDIPLNGVIIVARNAKLLENTRRFSRGKR